ncbi:Fibropellin-1 [Holothuria leucospilota]|uniref:Fibropellin-1 n=1 Tax=Holothuria leucospilota TaxID=206669 RepID=A0A9Q1HGE6_HOLLE|nr:Fibropellin-1 [Holothuria leucospilota]
MFSFEIQLPMPVPQIHVQKMETVVTLSLTSSASAGMVTPGNSVRMPQHHVHLILVRMEVAALRSQKIPMCVIALQPLFQDLQARGVRWYCLSKGSDGKAPDPCNSIICLNGGICNNGNCDCSNTGYSGINCGILTDACFSHPCKNDGTCRNFGTYFQCGCTAEFEGTFCESFVDPCLAIPSPCQNGASCSNPQGGQYFCNCLPQYTGTNCETEVNPCASDPCQSGSTCQKVAFGYQCQCQPGYGGINCDNVVDPCLAIPSPCQNGASCSNPQGGQYFCNCLPQYTGTNCETEVNPCASDPCQSGSTCQKMAFGYQCQCQPGYGGINCDNVVDPCLAIPSPCQNGASCSNLQGGQYFCNCLPQYTGTNCETEVNPCASDPCQSGSTCQKTAFGYQCQCQPGYGGINCENVVDPCLAIPSPCQNGASCSNLQGGQYFCNCLPQYTGTNCETEVNPCASDPCQSGSTCQKMAFGYQCQCQPGYGGIDCDNGKLWTLAWQFHLPAKMEHLVVIYREGNTFVTVCLSTLVPIVKQVLMSVCHNPARMELLVQIILRSTGRSSSVSAQKDFLDSLVEVKIRFKEFS